MSHVEIRQTKECVYYVTGYSKKYYMIISLGKGNRREMINVYVQ